jgi:hypothetical protein
MSLSQEIEKARKEIVSDGYDMSLGEVMNLYKDGELKINPEFQRLFRWDITRKTRFIESILLSIPIPPIFVFQDKSGEWELIDGLQRLSTVLEFAGLLKGPNGKAVKGSTLEGTKFLPSLANKRWELWNADDEAIDKPMQMQIKRARIRVEILLKESDQNAKYELFQRLNTGGAQLSEQEVRNCVAVMINPDVYRTFVELSEFSDFVDTVCQTDNAIEKQASVELVLRFFAFKFFPYKKGLDVHEYLDEALIAIATDATIDWKVEKQEFKSTFSLINTSLGAKAFKKWDGKNFSGMFLMSVYETLAHGISTHLVDIQKMTGPNQKQFIVDKAQKLWDDPIFAKSSGAGVRGTTRLTNLLPLAKDFFKP